MPTHEASINILRRDGTGLIEYVAGKANLLDLLEERFEIDIKQRTLGNKQLADQLAQTLLHIQSHLPGNIKLLDPKKNGNYTQSDFVEAYSKIAIGNLLLNEQYLPINQAGHRLVRNIARAVDTTRMFHIIGNAWLAYANSPEGKAHLEESGHSIADIMREAGFTFSDQIAQARATADQRTEVLQASNWQPAIEEELDALLEDIEAEEQLAEINQQQAQEPTTIPASESITGQEITIEPSPASEQETLVSPEPDSAADLSGTKATTILSHMRDLIAKGKARAEHFAIVFREIPGLTEAQAIEQGIRPLTQRGEPTAAYTQGKLLAERCTDVQYLLLKSGKLPQKAKRNILGAPTQTRKNPAWPKLAKKSITPADQRLTIIKALQNAVDYAAENPNYNLNFTRHIISKGREYYIATDGRRIAVIEHPAPKGSKSLEESLDKKGNIVKDAKFPESWQQVMISLTSKARPLDLAPYRYLETYPKTAINHIVWQDSEGKLSKYNPNYIGKGIKFFSTLSKAIGSPSTILVDNQNMGPILMQSDHNGWTAKYLLMPIRVVDGDIYKEGDILLNPQQDTPVNFSIKAETPTYTVLNDNVGLQEHLNDIVDPIEINFTTEKKKGGEWVKEALDYYLQELAGQELPIGDTGYTLHIKASKNRAKLATYNMGSQPRAEAFKKIKEVIAKSYRIGSEESESREKQSNVREDRVKRTATFERFGYPAVINGEACLIWFTGQTKNANDTDVLLAESGLSETKEGDTALTWSSQDATMPPNDITLGDALANVKGKIKGMPEIIKNKNTLSEHGTSVPTTAAESADLFTDGVLEAENAIVTKPGANFSIKPAAADTLDRFTADPLGERIIHHIRTEARRYARLLGDKTPYQQAVNAVQSAASIISAVDKYLHTPGKPVPARYRRQLRKLRSIAEKYAQIISGGTPRSFNKISPQ